MNANTLAAASDARAHALAVLREAESAFNLAYETFQRAKLAKESDSILRKLSYQKRKAMTAWNDAARLRTLANR